MNKVDINKIKDPIIQRQVSSYPSEEGQSFMEMGGSGKGNQTHVDTTNEGRIPLRAGPQKGVRVLVLVGIWGISFHKFNSNRNFNVIKYQHRYT